MTKQDVIKELEGVVDYYEQNTLAVLRGEEAKPLIQGNPSAALLSAKINRVKKAIEWIKDEKKPKQKGMF